MVVLLGLAVVAEHLDLFRQLLVVGHDGPGLAEGAQIFPRIEAEAAGNAHGAGLFTLVEGPVGLAGVLEDGDIVLLGDCQDRVHVGGLTEEMHGDDGPGARRDGALELCGVHVAGVGVDVDKDGVGPCKGDGLGRGDEGRGHRDHLVGLANAQGQQSQPDGVGSVAHADGIF